MAIQTAGTDRTRQAPVIEQKIRQVRSLYADAPEVGRVALENELLGLRRELQAASGARSAGRTGERRPHRGD
jgi:hypothetical protein